MFGKEQEGIRGMKVFDSVVIWERFDSIEICGKEKDTSSPRKKRIPRRSMIDQGERTGRAETWDT